MPSAASLTGAKSTVESRTNCTMPAGELHNLAVFSVLGGGRFAVPAIGDLRYDSFVAE
jgi:hypothetical protein